MIKNYRTLQKNLTYITITIILFHLSSCQKKISNSTSRGGSSELQSENPISSSKTISNSDKTKQRNVLIILGD